MIMSDASSNPPSVDGFLFCSLTKVSTGFLVLAGADEGAEEATEDAGEPAGEADGVEGPVGPSEFAETITFFPDFPDKSKQQKCRPLMYDMNQMSA